MPALSTAGVFVMEEDAMSELDKKVGTHGVVHVSVPVGIYYNADKMATVTKEVLGRLGCLACHSGFDIRFQQEVEFVVNVAGQVRALGE